MKFFTKDTDIAGLPCDYGPARPDHFRVDRIILAKGSDSCFERRRFIAGICELYPEAEIIESLHVPHNRIDLDEKDPARRAEKGKATLVFGEHKSAVRRSDEQGIACPTYWHFSPWGFCFYGCKYCYLSGTRTVWHSPTVKIFLNLEEILSQVDMAAWRESRPVAFYLGKLQDGLALDALTGYSEVMVPFFARHEFARMTLLTKSDRVERLLPLDHRSHTILSWSVNPPEIASRFEERAPPVRDRLRAMKSCADAGYPVRAVMMPLIPVPGWQDYYAEFTRRLLQEAPLQRLTMGGICIYRNARRMMEEKLGKANAVSKAIDEKEGLGDGRARYSPEPRLDMYSRIIEAARETRPETEVALCLEEALMWDKAGIAPARGRCNCVL